MDTVTIEVNREMNEFYEWLADVNSDGNVAAMLFRFVKWDIQSGLCVEEMTLETSDGETRNIPEKFHKLVKEIYEQ